MTVTAALLLVATALYAGFQWTIRIVVYPQFASVPDSAFAAYERRHQQLVSRAVGPLFVAGPRLSAGAAGACLAVVLGVTAFAAVPLHRALSDGFDTAAHRRLLRVDTVRLVAAAGAVGAAVWYAVQCR